MLVLTRKIGEAIQIGDDVTVEVLEVRGNRVRLGFSAPSSVSVHRAELSIAIPQEMPTQPTIKTSRPNSRHQIMVPVGS